MLLKLAWRNIWRNRRRSAIVLTAVVIGLVSLILTDGFYNGMLEQMLTNQIGSHTSHIQIHKKGFHDNKVIQSFVPDRKRVEEALHSVPDVEAYSERVITFGIISSASNSSGVSIVGISPEREPQVTTIRKSLVEGAYVGNVGRDIVIGKKLAEKLSASVGDKVVIMASMVDGSVGSDVFRISGVYETSSSEFDRSFVYVSLQRAQSVVGLGGNISEVAIITGDAGRIDSVKAQLASKLGDEYEVLSYYDLIPTLIMMVELSKESMVVYYLFIGIAIIFGIANAMLMSVFERTRELGILMANGMKSRSIFGMIIGEAFLLSLIGTAIGVGLGVLVHLPLSQSGINLSAFAEGLTSFGASSIVYPSLSFAGIVTSVTMIPIISIIAALYPAMRATRLEPVRAIHYV